MNKEKLFLNKKPLFFGFLIVILIIIVIWGFAFEKKKEPIRVAFNTKGGAVIFSHQYHTSLKNSQCQDCHHNYDPDDKEPVEMNCRNCHYEKELLEICEDENIHKRCIGKNCTDCHVNGSVDCTFCHNTKNFEKGELPKEIKFETDGGPVVFNHFSHASTDEYGLDCESCHHGYTPEKQKTFPMNCRRCHYNTKYKSLCEKNDYHVRCIGKNCLDCHSEGSEDCEICHKEE
jgi:hypothetical protein